MLNENSMPFCGQTGSQVKTVLIIDDHEDTVRTFSNILEANGYAVFGCYDGNSAIRQAGKIKPKIILLDHGLPDINGLEVLKELQKVDHYDKKIIMVSGTADSEIEKKAKKLGAFAYLSKPVNLGELLKVVKNAHSFPTQKFNPEINLNT